MKLHLRDTHRDRSNKVYPVEKTELYIGRGSYCDVILENEFVGLRHMRLKISNEDGISAELLSHSAATEHNGIPLTPHRPFPLLSGDEVKIENYILKLDGEIHDKEREALNDYISVLANLEDQYHSLLNDRLGNTVIEKTSRQFQEKVATILRSLFEKQPPAVSDDLLSMVVKDAISETIIETFGFAGKNSLQSVYQGYRSFAISRQQENDLNKICSAIYSEMELNGLFSNFGDLQSALDTHLPSLVLRYADYLNRPLQDYLLQRRMLTAVLDRIFSVVGPLEDVMRSHNVNEIMVVKKDLIYVERGGVLYKSLKSIESNERALDISQKIVEQVHRRVDRSSPMVDAHIPAENGEPAKRVNVVLDPISLNGPCITIRMFRRTPLTIDDLIDNGTLSRGVFQVLRAIVKGRRNVLISGGTGSGKTVFLNVLSNFIGESERTVTIEDTAELNLHQEHVVPLQTRPANAAGQGGYSIRDLVKNALRMRPDRIVVGECRGPEAIDMLQAMNTGHDGSMTTAHANTPRDMLLRLEAMVKQESDMPSSVIRAQITAALDIIVQLRRFPNGMRKVTHVTEVVEYDEDSGEIHLADIFRLRESGEGGMKIRPTGYLPTFLPILIRQGFLDAKAFC